MLALLALPVVVLQGLHAWLLARVWPRQRRGIVLGLLGLHLLLLLFPLALREGWGTVGLQMALRGLGHAVVNFQTFTAFHLTLAALAMGVAWLRRLPMAPTVRRTLLCASGAALLTAGLDHYGPRTCAAPRVVQRDLALADLPPALDGLRIAHLSDLHAGPHVDAALLQHWRDLAAAQHPDLLALTGDFVDARPEEVTAVCAAFQDFPAPLGRFAVLGNHDHHVDGPRIAAALRGAGIEVLDNTARRLEYRGTTFTLFGLQDPQAALRPRHFGPGPVLPDLSAFPGWRMALCHRPDQWPLALQGGASLTLCGHTHGGQINPLDGLSPARFLWHHLAGPYASSGHWLHVSPGLGVVGIPLRIQAPPEITLLTLRQKKTLAIQSS